jgi:hypothetical protein
MSYDNLGQSLKARIASWQLRKKFFWILGIALLSFIVWLLVILYYPYSEGTRTGVIRKLSHKGYIFKTWEGELQMSGIPIPSDANQVVTGGNVWSFSVDASNGEIIQALQKAESSGGRVTLHYIERLKQFDWRGDTKYFVKKVQ